MADLPLDAHWQKLLAEWSDDAAHAAFVARCRAEGQLGYAAARYREEARRSSAYRDDGQRADRAERQIRSITAFALLDLQATRSDPPSRVWQVAQALARWALAMLLLCALTYLALHLLSR